MAIPKRESKRQRPVDTIKTGRIKKKAKKSTVISQRPVRRLDVFVCGDGESGELGLGAVKRNGKRPTGVQSPRLNDLLDIRDVGVVQVSAGGLHCAALTHDSKVLTWGVNDHGALGRDTQWQPPSESGDGGSDGSDDDSDEDSDDDFDLNPYESTPIAVAAKWFGEDAAAIAQVAATDSATFALTATGFVYGWGTFIGNDGPLGFSADTAAQNIKVQNVPTLIPHLRDITTLATGSNHVLALDTHGAVFAWGINQQHQLGVRNYNSRSQPSRTSRFASLTPSPVFLPGRRIASISCGAYHSFALDDRGRVHAWGLNNFGQTGISAGVGADAATVELPTLVRSLAGYAIREIRGGNHHSIACCEDGALLVWGRCDDNQMGVDLETVSAKLLLRDDRGRPRILLDPTRVPGISAVSVAAGIDNSVSII